jgi:hypothetical protein
MACLTASSVRSDSSPSFSSATAMDRGVGCLLMPAKVPSFAAGPAAAQ